MNHQNKEYDLARSICRLRTKNINKGAPKKKQHKKSTKTKEQMPFARHP